MDGPFLKNKNIYESFRKWVDNSLDLRGTKHPLSSHISSFLEETITGKPLLELSIDLFLELVNIINDKQLAHGLMPILVIPIGYSEKIISWDESLSLADQLDNEPPSIYIFEREKMKFLEPTEEYRAPVNLNISRINCKNYNIYFRCFRDMAGIENDWEYCKAIYIEFYPDSLVF